MPKERKTIPVEDLALSNWLIFDPSCKKFQFYKPINRSRDFHILIEFPRLFWEPTALSVPVYLFRLFVGGSFLAFRSPLFCKGKFLPKSKMLFGQPV